MATGLHGTSSFPSGSHKQSGAAGPTPIACAVLCVPCASASSALSRLPLLFSRYVIVMTSGLKSISIPPILTEMLSGPAVAGAV